MKLKFLILSIICASTISANVMAAAAADAKKEEGARDTPKTRVAEVKTEDVTKQPPAIAVPRSPVSGLRISTPKTPDGEEGLTYGFIL